MSLFKNLFKSNDSENEQSKIDWIPLTEVEQLHKIIELSHKKPILIFKHSTRCGISRLALKNFESSYDFDAAELDIYFLDLIQYRDVSNKIVSKYNVRHESPQVIVFANKKVVYHDSHYGISVDAIKKAI